MHMNEYISLKKKKKKNYKTSILEEIIPSLVLKWYFKLGILNLHWLWIWLIWAGFLIKRPWLVTFSKFYQQKESLKKNKFHQQTVIAKKLKTPLFYRISIRISFFDIKINLGGLFCFCFISLFLQWIYILTNERNL